MGGGGRGGAYGLQRFSSGWKIYQSRRFLHNKTHLNEVLPYSYFICSALALQIHLTELLVPCGEDGFDYAPTGIIGRNIFSSTRMRTRRMRRDGTFCNLMFLPATDEGDWGSIISQIGRRLVILPLTSQRSVYWMKRRLVVRARRGRRCYQMIPILFRATLCLCVCVCPCFHSSTWKPVEIMSCKLPQASIYRLQKERRIQTERKTCRCLRACSVPITLFISFSRLPGWKWIKLCYWREIFDAYFVKCTQYAACLCDGRRRALVRRSRFLWGLVMKAEWALQDWVMIIKAAVGKKTQQSHKIYPTSSQ